ncbi:ELKS/Rab6-interacting/CAST family member 1-like isoform X2 [Lineus longissimus]|uniref:ELKS/Rab6-interacting/CAST family member 1-like isoform X2 n=1 Tax=Lineus longissimus TaxID=88925 RepID=UPI00315D6840
MIHNSMYAGQGSPRSSRTDISHVGQSPTKSSGSHSGSNRGSPVHNQVLSPNRSRRRDGQNQGVIQGSPCRSNSPLSLQMDSLQYSIQYSMPSHNTMPSLSNALSSHNAMPSHMDHRQNPYLNESGRSTSPVPSPRGTPFQSPSHSRSSSMTSMKNVMRDRSVERVEREIGVAQNRGPLVRDRSLDRQLDREAQVIQPKPSPPPGRDRSLDRDFLTRTLDRPDFNMYGRVRHGSLDQDYFLDKSPSSSSGLNSLAGDPFTAVMPHSQSRDHLLLDFQTDIANLNHECAKLQQELDLNKDKLNSTMNSIKTFWSPELKKERSLRKEESARFALLNEQLRQLQLEKQQQTMTIQSLEEQLRTGHDANSSPRYQMASEDTEVVRQENEKNGKEIIILRKTVEELELRVDTQKQTLTARDESIKKLLEMLQSKGLAVQMIEDDQVELEKSKMKIFEDEKQIRQLEGILDQRDREISNLKQRKSVMNDLSSTKEDLKQIQVDCQKIEKSSNLNQNSLHSLLDTKDSKITQLENDVRLLEDELVRLREDGTMTPRVQAIDAKQMEAIRGRERLMKGKIDSLQTELSRKETEYCTLQTKMETVEKQSIDQQHHIAVLKEQINAKEQRASILMADIADLRNRLLEKDSVIERKAKQVQTAQADKRRMENDLIEFRDQLDVKDRKVSVLQRKIENLEDLVHDKEDQLQASRARLTSLHADQSSSDSALSSLEESLSDREKQIERLKEQRDRLEHDHQEEIDMYQRAIQELKVKNDKLQAELSDRQTALLEVRDELSDAKTATLKKKSVVGDMEMRLNQKCEEIANLESEIKRLKEHGQINTEQNIADADKRVKDLEHQVANYTETVTKSHQEVDRLLEILKEMENEKHEKDKNIKELQDQIKEQRQKMGTLKRSQQTEKKKNAQLLEEARKREEDRDDDSSQLKTLLDQKSERIEELEEALRESVRITADREMLLAQQEQQLVEVESEVKIYTDELSKIKTDGEESDAKVKLLTKKLEVKENRLRTLQAERRQHLEEVYEMKQEAILAAISEKDANIGLLEMSASGQNTAKIHGDVERLSKEKDKLQSQLKELTQRRMKLVQVEERNNKEHEKNSEKLNNASAEQVVQAIRKSDHSKKKLLAFIDQLVAVCLENDPQLLEGLPRCQLDPGLPLDQLKVLPHNKLLYLFSICEADVRRLQNYANILLQRLRVTCPDKMQWVMTVLENG